MGMNIIPSTFFQKMEQLDMKQIVAMFDYFTDDFPILGHLRLNFNNGKLVIFKFIFKVRYSFKGLYLICK